MKHSVICILNETKEEYNVKTSKNDAKYSSLNIEEMDKSRELYSKEGDNSSRFEGKTVPWEHTILEMTLHIQPRLLSYRMFIVAITVLNHHSQTTTKLDRGLS